MNEDVAGQGPLERQVRPLVYIPRAIEDGERWIVGELRLDEVDERPFKCNKGWECAALYDQAALDTSVAAERERCAELVERGRVACNWNDREALAKFIREGLRVVGSDGQVA